MNKYALLLAAFVSAPLMAGCCGSACSGKDLAACSIKKTVEACDDDGACVGTRKSCTSCSSCSTCGKCTCKSPSAEAEASEEEATEEDTATTKCNCGKPKK